MPKTKTTKKKTVSGGMSSKKTKLNLRFAILIVIVIAALGGFYIFQKSSATGATRLSGGELYTKGAGQYYRLNTSDIYTYVSGNGYAGKSFCANGGALKDTRIEFGAYNEKHIRVAVDSGHFKAGQSFSLCFRLPGKDRIGNQQVKLKVSGGWKTFSVQSIK